MDIHVSIEGKGDRSERIFRQLLDAILDGRLRPGERLPSTRDLAAQLAVSRNTVSVAFERLVAEGYLDARRGAGTFVAHIDLNREQATPRQTRRSAPRGEVRAREVWRNVPDPLWNKPRPIAYDFSVGTPDPSLFPLEQWRRLVANELGPRFLRAGSYGDPAGNADLREAIARHLGIARSVRAAADDIVVTQGAQQAFDLIGRVLLEPGEIVAVEEPGYPPVRQLFESLGARVVGVPVDEHGIDVTQLPPKTRLIYVTPSHQFPLGTVMSLERRVALLEWASRHGAVILEDDYDSEYRFANRSLDPLQSLDRGGRVIYVGTFSKTMLPALRLGFLIAPASLRSALRSAKRLTDWSTDHVTQAAMARFVDGGHFSRHVRRATRVYAERHDRLVEVLQRDLGDRLVVLTSAAGLHVAVQPIAPGANSTGIAARAQSRGVAAAPLERFCASTPGTEGLVLGFGGIAAEDIEDGVRLLFRR
jgi:GntR family transcriptional regulator / MocR family aminotransferase